MTVPSPTPARIERFQGRWRAYSNFFVEANGRANEHYFQACKLTDPEARALILAANGPREAKRFGSPDGMLELSELLGREIRLRPDWEEIKEDVMAWGLRRKFADPTLRALLLASGEAELIEGNTWHDLTWGACFCAAHKGAGENRLGLALMALRAELRDGLRLATS